MATVISPSGDPHLVDESAHAAVAMIPRAFLQFPFPICTLRDFTV
jgi:hypothetical protein